MTSSDPVVIAFPSRVPPPVSTHDRLLDAAAELIVERGWGEVTMAKLADRVGVSRQTVYNGVGSKPALADALVMRELARFLEVVDEELGKRGEVVEAIRRTTRRVFELAEANPLLRAVLAASHGKENDALLPLFTTESEPLLSAAQAAVLLHLQRYETGLTHRELEIAVDGVVRLVISNVMRPGGTPTQTADQIAWIASRFVG